MPRPVRFIVAYLLLVAGVFPPGAAVPVAAQNTGVVEGVVVDVTTERPMVGAQIEVMDLEPGVSTDADGRFRIPMVPAGETFIKASASGYAIVVERIQVEAGEHARVEIRLGPLAGSTVREMAASPPPTAAI
ncbi:MAG: carboxypeptidase regulatory-like domain-containing protein, partial [Gemmatimonadetes bacterium]|nr:carboxypeptidase regulatory-like domain-containing protein [Gemmatimonadota bacterium]